MGGCPLVYDEGEIVRRVPLTKDYRLRGPILEGAPVSFRSETLVIRPLDRDGSYGIFFAATQVATIDMTDPKGVGHVPRLNTSPGHTDP